MSDLALRIIRGATTTSANTKEAIQESSEELARELIKVNNINPEDIAMFFITMTDDLTALNASSAIRSAVKWEHVPFFTAQEPNIDGMLPFCIRVSVQYNTTKAQDEIKHVYLREAAKLRPDLSKN